MRYFLELSYNGANYRGWQRQKDAPSVQQTLEEALATLLGEPVEVTGAGRTDTGVHAARYVAHFDTGVEIAGAERFAIEGSEGKEREEEKEGKEGKEGKENGESCVKDAEEKCGNGAAADFLYHANSILPPDIALRGIRLVADDAHARYDAVEREYTYYISPFKDPFRTATAWQYTVPLDLEAMNLAASHLLTVRDFTTFAKLGGGNKTNICRVTMAEWRRESAGDFGQPRGCLVFTIRADRFLRNMVRAIVGTLVDVGRGKISPAGFAAIVDARDLRGASGGAPARGLFLTDIEYRT